MKNDKNDDCGCLTVWIAVAMCIVGSFVFAYLVGASDLPDWFKFWLLK